MSNATKSSQDLVESFWSKLSDSPFIMLGTPQSSASLAAQHRDGDHGNHSEPMTAYFDDGIPNTLFVFASRGNRACRDGEPAQKVMAQFASKGHDFFACLRGTLETTRDEALIQRFGNDAVASWFESGLDDPELRLLRFELEEAELWAAGLTPKGVFKALVGASVGRDGVDGGHALVALD